MKKLGKKLGAVLLALSLVLGTGVAAGAASGKIYDVTVKGKELIFSRTGKTLTPYKMKTTDIKLQIDGDGDLLVCYTDTKGKYKGISLGGQRTIKIGGDLTALSLLSTLGSKVDVTIDDTADIDKLNISSRGDVTIEGDVAALNVSGAANVSVEGGASISTARVTSSTAKLSAEKGTSVKRVNCVNKSNITGSGVKTKISLNSDDDDNDYRDDDDNDGKLRVRLSKDSPIEVVVYDGDGDVRLRDIEDKIEDYVEAYGYDEDGRKRSLSGRYRWSDPSKKIFYEKDPESDSFTCKFKFTPSKTSYETVTDTIRVRVLYKG